jgi:hypothetical protein
MFNELGSLMGPDDNFSVLGHEDILSSELVNVLAPPAIAGRMIAASMLDARDGLAIAPFMARFILVSDPPDLGSYPSEQLRVITLPTASILASRGIGAAYQQVGSVFQLRPDVKGYIFERKRPFTIAEVDDLLGRLFESYPAWRDSYRLSRLALLPEMTKVDAPGGRVAVEPGNRLLIPAREAQPTRVDFPISIGADRITQIAISLSRWDWLQSSLARPHCLVDRSTSVTVSQGIRTLWSGPVPVGTGERIQVPDGGPLSLLVTATKGIDCGRVLVQVDFGKGLQ